MGLDANVSCDCVEMNRLKIPHPFPKLLHFFTGTHCRPHEGGIYIFPILRQQSPLERPLPKGSGSRRPVLRVWLLALAVLGIFWWFLLQKVGRFGLPLFVLAVVTTAPFFEVLELRATRLYRSLYVLVFAVTACILVFEPLYTIIQTVRYRSWNRAAYYCYPAVLDSLRPGSTILNLGHETLNFGLAGSSLANQVIPSWESPPRLTAEFLRSRQVDYVVEKVEKLVGEEKMGIVVDRRTPVEGLEIHFRSSGMEGEKAVVWRIWSASRLRNDSLPRLGESSIP